MKFLLRFFMVFLMVFAFLSCGSPIPGEEYVLQKIPVEIQRGKPIVIGIYLSGHYSNNVGIRCAPEVWNALNDGANTVTSRLIGFNKKTTQITVVENGQAMGFVHTVPGAHYLFDIYGDPNTKASVEITFPNAPKEVAPAEIIIFKTPLDTGL